eukprot:CAMPEP_0194195066 /NCGR_PEP_ID=MMETSP0154-20130528/75927_1 /TAXON_ID=1049557 /ORGANISM="Thalassiothrix antarctica, Strain L6-D1" /LENGTH=583 /DNA_ID=CAMNT_0038919553 /DNA_START=21 /DNA_END=1769 /DNA_ORIENTATION=-
MSTIVMGSRNNISSILVFLTLISLTTNFIVSGQEEEKKCWDDNTKKIFKNERKRNVTEPYTYIVCPDTTFKPGAYLGNGFEDKKYPLMLHSNARIQCGEDGDPSNNCVVDGSGTFGMLINPLFFGDTEASNIVVKGLTFSDFEYEGEMQNLVTFRASSGSMTLENCIFEYSSSEPLFEFTQYFPEGKRERQLLLPEVEDEEELNWKAFYYQHQQIIEQRKKMTTKNERKSISDTTQKYHRDLQSDKEVNISIIGCHFRDLALTKDATRNEGLSLLHFSGFGTSIDTDYLERTNINAVVKQTVFEGIDATSDLDKPDTHRSIITFDSVGKLTLDELCFRNIKMSTNGASDFVIASEKANATEMRDIYIDTGSMTYAPGNAAERECSFMSFVEKNFELKYERTNCGPAADATRCFLDTAAPTSSPVEASPTNTPVETPPPTSSPVEASPTNTPVETLSPTSFPAESIICGEINTSKNGTNNSSLGLMNTIDAVTNIAIGIDGENNVECARDATAVAKCVMCNREACSNCMTKLKLLEKYSCQDPTENFFGDCGCDPCKEQEQAFLDCHCKDVNRDRSTSGGRGLT